MNRNHNQTRGWLSVLILMLVSACSLPFISGKEALKENQPTQGQEADTGSVANEQQAATGGLAERVLPEPQAGLAQLPAYLAGFRQDAAGTLDGQPYERHTYLLISHNTGTGDYDFMNLTSGTGLPAYQTRVLAFDDAFYRWTQPDQSCQGSDEAPADGEVLEPASFLLPVMRAALLGNETVNGIDCIHYQFDEKDLNDLQAGTQVTGDVWIAKQGGYVVKYSLIVTPPADATPEGLVVTQTWSYDLSILDAGSAILLPPNCEPVPMDLPLPGGVQGVRRAGGQASFESTLSARQVIDFYLGALPGLGWVAPDTIPEGEISLPFMATFTQADQTLDLVLDSSEANLTRADVYIRPVSGPSAAGSQPTATTLPQGSSGTPTPVPTIDPAASGLPADIPLYPGATDLFSMDTVTMFTSTDSLDTVRKFYEEKLPGNGWVLAMNQSAQGTFMQQWSKSGTEIFLTFSEDAGRVNVVITRITE